jgi:branched-chain amino acid transport system permease protein
MTSLENSATLTRYRFHLLELAPLLVALAAFFLLKDSLAFAASVLVIALFTLSLDLILGFAGILSLGHAVFYGVGAYSAGLLAIGGWHEAVTGAIFGGAVAALLAAIAGPFILRLKGLPLIMVTLGLGLIVAELANREGWLTGGHDGLQGIEIAPLFGVFEWSIYGETGYLYALGWLTLLFLLARRLVASPFGVMLQGIRENALRMRVIGAPVLTHMVVIFTISAFIAGIAGAVSAQINAFVGLDAVSLELSVYTLAMLVLGGIGRLYGALIGAAVYMVVQYYAQQWNPYYWMFAIGALLIIVMRFGKGGLLGMAESGLAPLLPRRKAESS